MPKLSQLNGIAHNLAVSFLSPNNIYFLNGLKTLPQEKTKMIEIDLLSEKVIPEDIPKFSIIINSYKDWFLQELKKTKIQKEEIEEVKIKITYKPEKSFGTYYTCNATIKVRGKEYTAKVLSSYS